MDWDACETLVIDCTGPVLQTPNPLLPPLLLQPPPPPLQQPLPPNTYRVSSTQLPVFMSHTTTTGPVRDSAVRVSRTTTSGITYNATQSRSTIPVDAHSAMPTFERQARQSIERFMQDVRDVAGTSGGSTTPETTPTPYPRVVASAGDSSNSDYSSVRETVARRFVSSANHHVLPPTLLPSSMPHHQ
jgi:hypothetical protein